MAKSLPVFSEDDVTFVIDTVNPKLRRQRAALRESPAALEKMVEEGVDLLLERLLSLDTDRMLLAVSPRLLFGVFLVKAAKVLGRESYLLERVGRQVIPVFDARETGEFLTRKGIIPYLGDMLASFTKIESVNLLMGVKDGVWQRLRLNTLDIGSLIRFCSYIEEEEARFPFYKRIADASLFISGIFPEFASSSDYSRKPRAGRRTVEEYEREGKKYFALAAGLEAARKAGLNAVMADIAGRFGLARKALNFIADVYLRFSRQRLFDFDA